MNVRARIIVTGNVQEAGYRGKVITIAKVFHLTGWVQNLDDGRVSIIAEGEKEDINRFLEGIRIQNALIKVNNIKAEYSDYRGELNDFYKLVGEGETDQRLDRASEYLKELIDVTREGFDELGDKIDAGNAMLAEKIDAGREENRQGFGMLATKIDAGNAMLADKIETIKQDTGEIRKSLGTLENLYTETMKLKEGYDQLSRDVTAIKHVLKL
jgi:acylphosphatase